MRRETCSCAKPHGCTASRFAHGWALQSGRDEYLADPAPPSPPPPPALMAWFSSLSRVHIQDRNDSLLDYLVRREELRWPRQARPLAGGWEEVPVVLVARWSWPPLLLSLSLQERIRAAALSSTFAGRQEAIQSPIRSLFVPVEHAGVQS